RTGFGRRVHAARGRLRGRAPATAIARLSAIRPTPSDRDRAAPPPAPVVPVPRSKSSSSPFALLPPLLLHLHLGHAVLLLDLVFGHRSIAVGDAAFFRLALVVPVVARGHAADRRRHPVRLDDHPAAAIVVRAVPAS